MEYKLFDAEYRFMDIIWELEPVNSTQLCRVCQERLGWKKPTTYTVLRKAGGAWAAAKRKRHRNRPGGKGRGAAVRKPGRGATGLWRLPAGFCGRLFGTEKAHPKGGGGAEKTY